MPRFNLPAVVALLALTGPLAAQTLPLEDCFLASVDRPAQCATLAVPQNHADPNGPQIELHVAVLPALEEPAAPDPVFILAGGPGQSATAIAALVRRSLDRVNRERDIVLMDQRGTGASTPLACEIDLEAVAFDDEAKAAAIRGCLDGWDVDPRYFTTPAHVADLELMRQALGYERINLYGGSYGTRVGLVYLREHPEALRTAVLDAVAPLDMRVGLEMGADAQSALTQMFEDCAAEAACAARYPNLASRFEELMRDLAATPVEVAFRHPATAKEMPQVLDHRAIALGIRALLYSPSTRRTLPAALDAAMNGDFLPLIGLTTAATLDLMDQITPGLLFAVLCAEDIAGATQASISEAERQSFVGTAQATEFIGYCEAWPEPLAPADWTPPKADVPTLLLSGGLDPVTPPAGGSAAAKTLPNSRHIVVENGGHIVAGLGCMPRLVAEFIETSDPDALDDTCAADVQAPSFFTSIMGPTTGSASQ